MGMVRGQKIPFFIFSPHVAKKFEQKKTLTWLA